MSDIFKQIDALQAKINAMRPLSVDQFRIIKEYYRIVLTYTSNAMEGNSLTETETKIVLEDGLTVDGKPLRDHMEALGHSHAYDLLYASAKKIGFTQEIIKQLHHLFYFRIDESNAGVYRTAKVRISGSAHALPAPDKLESLMQEFIQNYGNDCTMHPVEWAAKIHKEFVFIHPFIDGNGRVSRLLMNMALLQHGYEIAIIPPVLRREYFNCLEKAHTDDRPFIEFIARAVKESQQDYLRMFGD
jgi:Fic family protein